MTRQELTDLVESYLHRSDFTGAQLDNAIATTTRVLGTRLRIPENESQEVVLAGWVEPVPLPATYRNMRAVEAATARGIVVLRSVTKAYLEYYKRLTAGGASPPAFYSIYQNSLYVAPLSTPELTISYFQEPAALGPNPTDTTPILDAYPELYLYRVLGELSLITQDPELVSAYVGLFDARVAELNKQAGDARAGADLAIRSV